jgi:hypothetical protein
MLDWSATSAVFNPTSARERCSGVNKTSPLILIKWAFFLIKFLLITVSHFNFNPLSFSAILRLRHTANKPFCPKSGVLMSYIFHRREPEDKKIIVINEQWQITYWMLTLQTTQDKLVKLLKR